jgi:hypothetical protein
VFGALNLEIEYSKNLISRLARFQNIENQKTILGSRGSLPRRIPATEVAATIAKSTCVDSWL